MPVCVFSHYKAPLIFSVPASLIASLAHTRAGIPDAMTTVGAIDLLIHKLYSKHDQVGLTHLLSIFLPLSQLTTTYVVEQHKKNMTVSLFQSFKLVILAL